ncbi:MAG: DUF5104 domain-containing protein [Clostridia bacterium]|nr:DUF5104 domain-containing protein [Clostridia bacterium]
MNKAKFYFLAALVIAVSFLSGCSDNVQQPENPEVREDVEIVVAALEQKDSEFLYNTYFNYMDKEKFNEELDGLFDIIHGEITNIRFYNTDSESNYPLNNDSDRTYQMNAIYIVDTTKSTYMLTMNYSSTDSINYVLSGFSISDNANFVVNSRYDDYNTMAWILFILNFISYGIMIVAFILCMKTRINRQVLWTILILIQTGFTITIFPNNFNISTQFIWLLGISRHLVYAHGGTHTTVVFHVFAAVFLVVRKSLHAQFLKEEELAKKFIEESKKQTINNDINKEKTEETVKPKNEE